MRIGSISRYDATGALREQYEQEIASMGHVTTDTLVFSVHYQAIEQLRMVTRELRSNMPPLRYELIQLAVSLANKTPACIVAHGAILAKQLLPPEQVGRIVADFRSAELEPSEVAVMAFAQKVATGGRAVEQADVDSLRALGFSDAEILDVTLAAAVRSLFTRVFDALAVEADPGYLIGLEPALAAALLRAGRR